MLWSSPCDETGSAETAEKLQKTEEHIETAQRNLERRVSEICSAKPFTCTCHTSGCRSPPASVAGTLPCDDVGHSPSSDSHSLNTKDKVDGTVRTEPE